MRRTHGARGELVPVYDATLYEGILIWDGRMQGQISRKKCWKNT